MMNESKLFVAATRDSQDKQAACSDLRKTLRGWSGCSGTGLPEQAVELMPKDKNVECIMAADPSTAPYTLSILAGSGNVMTRRAVAENPSSSHRTLERLLNDNDETVRNLARASLDSRMAPPALPGEMDFLEDPEDDPMYDYFNSEEGAISQNFKPMMAWDNRGNEEWMQARENARTATTYDELMSLARDSDWVIRAEVARNQATPPEILSVLCNDKEDLVGDIAFSALENWYKSELADDVRRIQD